jgi:hypothetical protein
MWSLNIFDQMSVSTVNCGNWAWRMVRAWEHELKEPGKVAARVRRVYET